jgi:putative intracellular protease/amidase
MPLPHQSNIKRKSFDLTGYKALIITTSQKTLDLVDSGTGAVIKKGKATGVYAAEMTEPYYVFLDAKMDVDIASVEGGEIPIDPLSLKPFVRTPDDVRYLKDPVFKEKTAHALSINEIRMADYDIIFLSGGWGAAYDFAQSKLLAEKISEAYAAKKILGAVCHGPLGFIGAHKPDGSPLVEGVRMTGVTNKQLRQLMVQGTPKHPESELRRLKALYKSKSGFIDMFNNLIVVDKNHLIITGQNQKAGVGAAQEAIQLLLDKKQLSPKNQIKNE